MRAGYGRVGFYPVEEMDTGFDLLPDQNLAYRQSLLLVDYIVQGYGFPVSWTFWTSLAREKKLERP